MGPHRGEKQADREIGDLVGQHVRGVGDDEAAPAGFRRIDMVVADAEARDDLEVRQYLEQRGVDPVMTPACGHAANARADLFQQGFAIRRLPEFMHGELRLELIGGIGHQRAGHDDLGGAALRHRENPGTALQNSGNALV